MSPKINNDILLNLIRRYPYLYCSDDPKYKDHKLKESTWIAISNKLQVEDVTNVKTRWRTLRDRYTKDKLRYAKKSSSSNGDVDIQPPKWRLYKAIEALLDPSSALNNTNFLEMNGGGEKMELITGDLSIHPVSSDLELDDVSNVSAPQHANVIGLNEILEDNPKNLKSKCCSPMTSDELINRKKVKIDDNQSKTLSLMQELCCNLIRTQEASIAVINKFTDKNNDDAYYYGQCLISRFRALPKHKFFEARMEIEKILYRIESELQNE